jgi:hypothetical protein
MMELVPPPQAPRVGLTDRPGGKTHRNLRLIIYTAVTVFLTAWFCTMGPIPAILAIVVAKHVLVAILLLGLGIDHARREPA